MTDPTSLTLLPQPKSPPIQYPSIPAPTASMDSLLASVSALKQAVELLTGQVRGVRGAVTPRDLATVMGTSGGDMITALDDGFSILDQAIATLNAEVTANINTVNTTLTNDVNDAIATFTSDLTTQSTTLTAAITSESVTRANADTALAGQITTLGTTVAGNTAAITNEAIARSNADSALATTISTVSAVAGRQRTFVGPTTPTAGGVGDIWIDTANGNLIKVWDGANWNAWQDTGIALAAAAISTETTARAAADSAIAAQVTTLTSVVNANTAAISNTNATLATDFQTTSESISSLTTSFNNLNASVTDTNYTRGDKFSTIAGEIASAQVSIGNASAQGLYRIVAVAASDTGVAAEFDVEVSANGSSYSSAGMRIQALGTGQSRIKFEASQFIFAEGDFVPFEIDGANIRFNGIISGLKIDSSTVSTAQIAPGAVSNITVATGAGPANITAPVSSSLSSTVLSQGVTTKGGQLCIDASVTIDANITYVSPNAVVVTASIYVDGSPLRTVQVPSQSLSFVSGSTLRFGWVGQVSNAFGVWLPTADAHTISLVVTVSTNYNPGGVLVIAASNMSLRITELAR